MTLHYKDALATVDARGFGIKPDLSRIRRLLQLTDNPQRTFPTVHIAGTNGKTSTARILGAILAGHGLNAGIYTSPHLQSVRERMSLAGWGPSGLIWEQISEDEFAATLEYLQPFVGLVEHDLGQMTYFEVTTALAFEWMAERAVAAGVIEVGLGGRWDATNLIDSSVAILTHIDVDHRGFLGSTPLENAREKVDIIKQGGAVTSDSQASEVAELVVSEARQLGAKLAVLERDFHVRSETAVGGRVVSIHTSRARYVDLYLPLHGSHQATNMALAVAAAEEFLERPLDNAALAAAIGGVSSPGRLEVVGHRPLVILDGAHNPHASAALVRSLQHDFRYREMTMVIAFSEDKDIDGMLSHLIPLADRVIFSRFDNPRAADPAGLATRPAAAAKDAKVVESLAEAADLALMMSSEEDMVVITGSLYAVGEAREHLLGSS